MGSVGATQPPVSPPKPCRGHQSQQDRDCCCCAQVTASPWQFCILSPETTFPLLLIPCKAWEALLYPAVLPFPENSYWEFQHFSHPPSKKHLPFFFPPWESHWDSPLHDALSVSGSAAHQDAPKVQSLPASSSKRLQGVQGGHSPAGC